MQGNPPRMVQQEGDNSVRERAIGLRETGDFCSCSPPSGSNGPGADSPGPPQQAQSEIAATTLPHGRASTRRDYAGETPTPRKSSNMGWRTCISSQRDGHPRGSTPFTASLWPRVALDLPTLIRRAEVHPLTEPEKAAINLAPDKASPRATSISVPPPLSPRSPPPEPDGKSAGLVLQ